MPNSKNSAASKAESEPAAAQGMKPSLRSWKDRSKSFIAGMMFVVTMLLSGAYSTYEWINGQPISILKIPELVSSLWNGKTDTLFAGNWYISIFYKGDKDPIQTWHLKASGVNSFTGEIEDLETGSGGVAVGYLRNATVTLAYGSANSDDPGYGTFFLQRVRSAMRGDSDIWVGTAIVHDCQTVTKQGQRTKCASSVLLACPAILSQRREPTAADQADYFSSECIPVNRASPPIPQPTT